jgi:hypothetical protein
MRETRPNVAASAVEGSALLFETVSSEICGSSAYSILMLQVPCHRSEIAEDFRQDLEGSALERKTVIRSLENYRNRFGLCLHFY